MLRKLLPKLIFPVILLILVGVLCYRNYVPGTILSGWDTLHPEFNFSLYLNRSFFGTWMEHQGIGAPAAQAFSAELTRLPIVYLLTLFLPMFAVRWAFFFLTLGAGTLGMYFLAKFFLGKEKYSGAASFLGASFYLLNLATMQQFFDPLEMFAIHFATLPFLLLFASKYLKEKGKKNLIWFSVVTLLATGMAATATLFYAYFAAFCLFISGYWILERKREVFKKGFILIILTLALNSFWLLPNIYYVVREARTVENSKISRTFSDEAYLQSRAFGNVNDLVQLKNFPFNWREYDFSSDSFEDLMRVWDDHLSNPAVANIGVGMFVFALYGIIVAVFKKSKLALSLAPVLALGAFFWLAGIPKELSVLREALRFPFTKFSFLIVAGLSVFLSFSSQAVLELLNKIKIGFVFVILILGGLIVFMLPAFNGNFIDPAMKVKIPSEYFQAFDWFDHQDSNARVAKLPMQTFWDWNYYSWGYQGGGFTWFGIKEPTMDREFDRWGAFNEDFYTQASSAIYGNDPAGFMAALQKYQIKYLFLDESVLNAGGKSDLLYIPQTKAMLGELGIKPLAKFGFLTIYDTGISSGNDFVSAPKAEINNVSGPLVKGNLLKEINLSVNQGFSEAYNCDIKKLGTVSKDITGEGIDYKADMGGVACDYINFADLKYKNPYIIHVEGRNLEGRSLKVYFTNWKTGRADIEELMPGETFSKDLYIYPANLEGSGYSLNFETRSYGPVASENIVTKVEVFSAQVPAGPQLMPAIENNLKITDVKKYGSWAYVINTEGQGILELGQGYEKGWAAISVNGQSWSILNHFKFNSWANAWNIPQGASTVLVVYWPQFLEFTGMILAILALMLIIP